MEHRTKLINTGSIPTFPTFLLAAQLAALTMDIEALTAYGTPELALSLKDPATREKTLNMLKSMTAPQARILGGLQKGDTARLAWVQHWPAGLDNRCVDTMTLKDGKWRSTESACQSE